MLRLFIFLSISIIYGCTNTLFISKDLNDSHRQEGTKNDSKGLLCKYTERKGIAELLGSTPEGYHFIFFPGNIEFDIARSLRHRDIKKGSEFKASVKQLVQGPADCEKFSPRLAGN